MGWQQIPLDQNKLSLLTIIKIKSESKIKQNNINSNQYLSKQQQKQYKEQQDNMRRTFPQQSQHKQANETKLYQDCLKILSSQSIEQNNKWLSQNKINSYTLRNDKAGQIVTTMNYLFQKAMVAGNLPSRSWQTHEQQAQNVMLSYLFVHYKSIPKKVIEFIHLIKHFSLWDYEFQFYYEVFLGRGLQNVNLYMQCRNQIMQSAVNKYKKSVLSGVLAEIQQWSKLAQNIFRTYDERMVIEQFVQVVKLHFVQVKKNQNQRLNGAEFFKICQIMADKLHSQHQLQFPQKTNKTHNKYLKSTNDNHNKPAQVFRQSLINDLTMQDRELIRILSCKDKNIARLLQQKHNKMVNKIGQQVNSLRKDIEIEKRKYLQVIQEKKYLFHQIQRIKRKTLDYVADNSVKNQQQLLQMFQTYNKKYNPHSLDVEKCKQQIATKRLLELIEEQQKML